MRWAWGIAVLVAACGSGEGPAVHLTSSDASTAGPEAGGDLLVDSGADAGAGGDLLGDAGADAGAGGDLPVDSGADAGAGADLGGTADPDAGAGADLGADVPPIPDAVADAAPAADADAKDAGPAPLGPLTHPLLTAADVLAVLDVHQTLAGAVVQVVDRQYQTGNATCPGLLAKTGGTFSDNMMNACTIQKGDYAVDVFGAWKLEYTDPCAKTAHHLYNVSTTGAKLKGKDGAAGVELALDVAVAMDAAPSEGTFETYTWAGKGDWKKLPAKWAPDAAASLGGHVVSGVQVQRSGTQKAGAALSGWLAIDGQGVQVDTLKPLKWLQLPKCAAPSEGQIRLQGVATVLITFAAGTTCAAPTWTRDGVAMGTVPPTFWGWQVVCKP